MPCMQLRLLANANAHGTERECAGHGGARCPSAFHGRWHARNVAGCGNEILGDGRMLAFETENLLQLDEKAVIPVLLYLFRRIEQRFDGSPTLILLDEAWAYLQHELFRERLKDWLKTMRRKNAAVVLATQQISDVANSDIADVVLENCSTKILLPNAEARNPGTREFYGRIGLNDRELDILQVSIPKKHYYVISKLGRRLVDLGVGKVALSWVGVNGKEERQIVESVMEQFPDTWREEWLRLKGLDEWADYFRALQPTEMEDLNAQACNRNSCRLLPRAATSGAGSGRRVRDGVHAGSEPRPVGHGVHPTGTATGDADRPIQGPDSERQEPAFTGVRIDSGGPQFAGEHRAGRTSAGLLARRFGCEVPDRYSRLWNQPECLLSELQEMGVHNARYDAEHLEGGRAAG